MKRFLVFLLLLTASATSFYSCSGKKKAAKQQAKELLQDQTLTINIFPFWGGSANAVLERKNGKDVLINFWVYKEKNADTTVTSSQTIEKNVADSIFFYAEKIKWNDDVNYGTSEATADTKTIVALKKGHFTKTVMWDRLKSVAELPADILLVVKMVNDISPAEVKLY
jgi:hypothetical protein